MSAIKMTKLEKARVIVQALYNLDELPYEREARGEFRQVSTVISREIKRVARMKADAVEELYQKAHKILSDKVLKDHEASQKAQEESQKEEKIYSQSEADKLIEEAVETALMEHGIKVKEKTESVEYPARISVYHLHHDIWGNASFNFGLGADRNLAQKKAEEIWNDREKNMDHVADVYSDDLEEAYRLTNSIDKNWWKNYEVRSRFTTEGCRSTSVGDFIVKHEMDGDEVYVVAGCGFIKVKEAA